MSWRLSPAQRVWIATCVISIGGGLFGTDTGSIGAITTMPAFEQQFGGRLDPVLRGLVVSLILPSSVITGIMAGSISDKISRKFTISLGGAIFALGSILSAASFNLAMLIVGRVVAGLGEGLFLGCSGVYLCEISPKKIRGQVTLIFQLFTAGGVAAGFFICYGTVRLNSSLEWRLPFIIQAVSAITLCISAYLLPYSPRWLLSKGRRDEAERTLDLFVSPADVADRLEMLSMADDDDVATANAVAPMSTVRGNKKAAFMDIWRKDVRGRTVLGLIINVGQQLSGIDFVLFFAPDLFRQAGLDEDTASFVASGVTGLLLMAAVVIGYFYIDRIGRRPLYLVGGFCISTTLFVIGSLYASGGVKTSAGKWTVIVMIELFAIFFAGTWSLVVRLYTSEIQPTKTRAVASSTGQAINQLANFVVALTAPQFLARSSWGPYMTYGAFSALSTLIAFLFMFETKGRSLESINLEHKSPISSMTRPHFFKRLTGDQEKLKNQAVDEAKLKSYATDGSV
ncbi:hypothetical protein OIV83_001016 [Microbotryomycetes sp. JL201]|nr:hypothetical protein OIV83_001016 [Microbotryomycetes sp. JL201]